MFALTETQQNTTSGSPGQLKIAFNSDGGFGLKVDAVRFQAAPPASVPEPGTLALVGLALAGTVALSRRRRS